MPAVSNTSPIFNLASIDRLDLLHRQFEEVLIPDAVLEELAPIRHHRAWAAIDAALQSGWLSSRTPGDHEMRRALSLQLDSGEDEAIALALELSPVRLLIDERDGRSIATRMGIEITGVLGVLLKAKRQGDIDSIGDAMTDLRQKAGFFIRHDLYLQMIEEAGE